MKRNFIALAVVVLLAWAAIAWLWFASTSHTPASATNALANAAKPAAEGAAELGGIATDKADLSASSTAVADGAASADRRAAASTSSAALGWVQGSVQIPSGTPSDELLELWAFASATDPVVRASELSRAAVADAEHDEIVARCPIGPDGAFHCAVPSDRGALWLVLAGRYCYADAGVRVDLTAGEHAVSFEPHLGAWITGRLILPTDATETERDLGKEKLELGFDALRAMNQRGPLGLDELRRRRVRASDELAFEFRGVHAGVDYRLQFKPDHLAAVRTSSVATAAGQHVVIDPQLSRGGTLLGTVRDPDGHPIAKATIKATTDPMMFGRGGFEVRDGKSEADGTYTLAAVAAGKLTLGVEADGFLEGSKEIELGELQRVEGVDFVLQRGSSIAGRVTWPDGSAAASIDVDVSFDMSQIGGMGAFNAMQGASGKAPTDADGHFEVSGLGKGPFTVKVLAPEKGSHTEGLSTDRDDKLLWRARADGVKPGTRELELVLAAPQGIAGRITDHDGKPIAKFTVVARSESKGMIPGLGADKVSQSYSDDNGEFFLSGLGNGRWEIGALAEGFAPSASTPIALPRPSDAARLELVLDRVGTVTGTVLTKGGTPAPGAEVTLKLAMQDVVRAGLEDRKPPKTRADAEGHFVLTGLSAGNLSVVAHAEGAAESEPAVVALPAAETVDGIVLHLRDGGLLTGEIFAADGAPLAGASMMVSLPIDPLSQRWGNADGAGHFEFEHLTEGMWNVIHLPMNAKSKSASGGDGGDDGAGDALSMFADMKITAAKMVEGETTHVVLGAPAKNPVHIHGRTTLEGKGIAGLFITFMADGGKGMDQLRMTSTSGDGAFAADLQAPGGYMLSVQKPGNGGSQQSWSTFLRVPEQPDFEHDVELPVAGISGTVRKPDGSLAPGVRVSLMVEGAMPNGALFGEQFAEIATDDNGAYELSWLRPGNYTVAAGGAAFASMFGGTASNAPARQLKSGLHVTQDQWLRDVDFKLEEPGSVQGLVRDSAGKPLQGAGIFVRDSQGRLLERLSMLSSDATGHFEVPGLGPGEYSMIARTESAVTSQDVAVRVHKGEASDVELVVQAGTKLIVSLANEQGETVECSLEVTDESGRQVNGMMSFTQIMTAFSQGRFSTKDQEIGPLAPGKYKVVATTKDGHSVTKPVTLSGQTERRLNLKL